MGFDYSGVKRSGLTLDIQEKLRFASLTVRGKVCRAGVLPHPRKAWVAAYRAGNKPAAIIYIKFTILRRDSQGLSPPFLTLSIKKS